MIQFETTNLGFSNFLETEFARKSRFHWDFVSKYSNSKERWDNLALQYAKHKGKEKDMGESKVPKIIHQIWIGPKRLPEKYKKWMRSWKLLNPEWEYIFWDNSKIKQLGIINNKVYKEINNVGFRSDLLRYTILEKYGGLYVDTDFECLTKLPEFLLNYDYVSGLVFGFEPQINNAIILAKPNCFILNKLVKEITKNRSLREISVFEASGPDLLTKIYFNLDDKEKNNCLIVPSNFFYPYPSFLVDTNLDIKKFITEDSIGIHYWERSWFLKPIFIRFSIKLINQIRHSIKYFLKKFYYIFSQK